MLYIFDENYSYRIAEGLNLLESGNSRPNQPAVSVKHITKLTGRTGAPDTEVIETAGEHGGILFTKDKDFRQIKAMEQLYRRHKVGVVFFKQHKNGLLYWDNVKTLINRWEDLKAKLINEIAPFAYQVSKDGVSKFHF